MGKYTFDDLVEVANINQSIFKHFPGTKKGRRRLNPPTEDMLLTVMGMLQRVFPKDYRLVVLKWGYLALGKDNGFFGVCGDFFNKEDFKDLDKPLNVYYETRLARKSIGLPEDYIVIWGDARKKNFGVIDTETGKVLSYDRSKNNSYKVVSDSFIDYVFRELILHRRANEIVYDTTFHWPEYLQDRIADDMLTLKEELDESDKLFDRYEEMLKNA